jgi:broad specificity phosphatase PhoE
MSEPFVVEFVSGAGLPGKDINVSMRGVEYLSDPYVRCELKDAQGNAKGLSRASAPKLRTLDPVWRFMVDFNLAQGDVLPSDELHVSVYDEDLVGSDDNMGCARITVGSLAPAGKRYVLDTSASTPAAAEADRAAPPSMPGRAAVCALTVRKVPIESLPKKMTLFMVRHGESKWNEAQEGLDVYGMLKQVDHPLNLVGIQQCAKLQQKIAAEAEAAAAAASKPEPPSDPAKQQALREEREQEHGQVAQTFYEFDADNSGYLDEGEVKAFCLKLGLLLSEAEVTQALSEMESDGTRDGKIEFDEFVAWWNSGSKTKAAGSIAFRLQQAKEEAFAAELGGSSPMGRLLQLKTKSKAKETPQPEPEPELEPGAGAAAGLDDDPVEFLRVRKRATTSASTSEDIPEATPPQPGFAIVNMTVPDGVSDDNRTIEVELPDGSVVELEVPEGLSPGDEFEAEVSAEMDLDGDGAVSQDEIAKYKAAQAAAAAEAAAATAVVGVEDWLAAQAIFASPLRRATQTCLIAVKGHPALLMQQPMLTLLSSAREIKKLGAYVLQRRS